MSGESKLADYVRLQVKQGDRTDIVITVLDDDGQPEDLTGKDVEFSVAPRKGTAPIFVFDRTDTEEVSVVDATGEITISFTPTLTRAYGTTLELVSEVTLITPAVLPATEDERTTLADILVDMRREAVDESQAT